MSHLFLTQLWRQFASFAGIQIEGLQLSQVIIKWWTTNCGPKLKPLMRVVPAIIIWNLWKRRNNLKHGRKLAYNSLVHKVDTDIWKVGSNMHNNMKNMPMEWKNIVDYLENYTPKIHCIPVSWNPPERGVIKCNTDGASRGNPGRSTYSFCLRDSIGDLIYAQGEEIQEGTNVEAEAIAIREALAHCVVEGIELLLLETDSLLLHKVLTKV